ncbi:MAG: tRNA pseudouridine(13) synthase TruD [Leptolyngbya sp. PLA1]|nr:tRNA pseudouridine(13) synthase TruD [Leptolyngbya sp. PLA1]
MKPDGAGELGTHVAPRAYLTAGIPPLGGVIKQRPEDFLVDELPAYQPCGEGEHIYMLVQKRGLSSLEMIGVIARHFGVARNAVGYAGLKDKHAITRQVVSVHVPGKRTEDFPAFEHEQIEVLWVDRHTNKLRPGHLRGNRFSIKVRNVAPTAVLVARKVLASLKQTGVPNRFGEQRFGLLENNHLVGRAIVKGDWEGAAAELLGPSPRFPGVNQEARALFAAGKYREAAPHFPPGAKSELVVLKGLADGKDARRAFLRLDETVLRYYLSAFQSAVFNAVLDGRVLDGELGGLHVGDLAFKHANGAVFDVTEGVMADTDTDRRLSAFEISPSGPMWGAQMPRGGGRTDHAEVTALANLGLTPEDLVAFGARAPGKLEGKRRPLRVPLIDPEVEGGLDEHGPYVRCAFELPRGSFATVVLREIMKPAQEVGQDAPDED